VDGQQVDEALGLALDHTLATNNHQIWLGRRGNNDFHFDGDLDEVRIWDVVRSETEIQANLHRRLRGDEPGLVGYFPLDAGVGSVAPDQSATGNDASFSATLVPEWITPGRALHEDLLLAIDRTADAALALDGADPEGGSVSAHVTAFPASGRLFQTSDGVTRGLEILGVPALVTDPLHRVIYVPDPGTETDPDGFPWVVNDGLSDSVPARVDLAPGP